MGDQTTKKIIEGRRGGHTEVVIPQGSTLAIQLEGNPATGYAWTADTRDVEVLDPTGSGFEGEAGPGLTGAFVFTFTARATGTTAVAFTYRRPWEKGGHIDPAHTYTARVTVSQTV
ncbi:protease inhibitor I42 family protein [Streptomyces sp. NPDC058701]|uniref:protease inhibitor I42 family protein n=1 Tax=Streptomyces sp. NPDC058701 TaxID=3346608 RepID=UPI0036496FBD